MTDQHSSTGTESAHTPTPWTLHDRWLIGPSGPLALASGYRDYVTAPGGPMYQEWLANAAFIVKAVNAHDALVKALEEIEYASREDSLSKTERLQSVRTIVCAALSQVRP